MKTTYFFILSSIILCCNSLLHAQEPKENWILQASESGNKDYVAREGISLKPGFTYKASPDNTFTARIDPTLLFPPAENTYIDWNGNITGSSAQGSVVGRLSGAFNVSATGAATYSIPIEVPSGIQGMQPNISLVYNSQSGNGIAGWGWSLSGLSAITAGNKTVFSDDAAGAVFGSYYLDGNRLIKSGSGYETENKTYTQIKQLSAVKWTVTGKDGTVMEYGQSITPKNMVNAKPFQWLLTKVTDSNGNYMTYTYKTNTAGTQTVLESISYGSNGTTQSPLKVQFYYTANPYSKKQYVSGGYFEDSQLLVYITVTSSAGNYQLRRYDLIHYQKDQRNFMIFIQKTGENGEKFPALDLAYGADDKTVTATEKTLFGTPLTYTVKSRYYAAADIKGNGYTDLFEFTSDEYGNIRVRGYDGKTFQNSYTEKFIGNSGAIFTNGFRESTFLPISMETEKKRLLIRNIKL